MRKTHLLSMISAVCLTVATTGATALDIALTNDDGWNATGIQVMRSALEAAGHHVILAAPLSNQSGSSMALDLTGLAVKKRGDNQYSVSLWNDQTVSARPGTCGLVAIGIVQESGHSPDLLISGINTSANIGMETMLSGTVSAASHAVASVMNGPVPAIAVGTDEPACDSGCKEAHYQIVADFIVRLIAHLETKPGFLAREPELLPAGVALVVSYPSSDSTLGIKVATHSNAVLSGGQRFTGAYRCAGSGCSPIAVDATKLAMVVPMPDSTPDNKNADLDYYLQGFITIVPVSPDLNVISPLMFKSVFEGFNP